MEDRIRPDGDGDGTQHAGTECRVREARAVLGKAREFRPFVSQRVGAQQVEGIAPEAGQGIRLTSPSDDYLSTSVPG